MRRKTEANLKELHNKSAQEQSLLSGHRISMRESDHLEAVSAIGLSKRVARYFAANFGSRFDKLDHEINRDKRFLIFEAKQTPIYVNFFDKLTAELGGDQGGPAPQDKNQLSAPAVTKGVYNGAKKEGTTKKSDLRTVDVTPVAEEEQSDEPTYLRGKKKVTIDTGDDLMRKSMQAGEKTKPKQLNPANQVTSHNFQSIKTEAPPAEKQANLAAKDKKEEHQPTGREFKRKDPVPIFRPQPKAPTVNTPKGANSTPKAADDVNKRGFKGQKDDSHIAAKPATEDFSKARRSVVFTSDTKEAMKRRATEVGLPDKFSSQFTKIREDVSEDESEGEKADVIPLLKRKTLNSKDGDGSKNQMHGNPLNKHLNLPIHDFALTPDQLNSRGFKAKDDQGVKSIHSKDGKGSDLKLSKGPSDGPGLQKSMTSVGFKKGFTFAKKSDDEDSVDEMLLESRKEFEKKKSLKKSQEAAFDFMKTQSVNSMSEIAGLEKSKVSTPRKSLTKKLRSAEKDRMMPEIKSIMAGIVERAVARVDEIERDELRQINDAEEHMRQEAKKAEKKIKKEIRAALKAKIYDLMLMSMPEGSKLPSLFLAAQKSESSLLIESVKKGVEKTLQGLEADIKDIYSQYEELRRLSPAEIPRLFPFEISNLSYFTLKTVPENEVKDALTIDRLSKDMLAVFRLFYFIHFPGKDFAAIEAINQKTLMGEIADLYQARLRHIEAGDQPVYRELAFKEKLKMEDFLMNNKSLFSVISDMSLKPFSHSICFYTFEILFYYGMKSYVKFMEKAREKDKNMRNSAYQLVYLLEKMEMLEGNLREFAQLQRQFEMK